MPRTPTEPPKPGWSTRSTTDAQGHLVSEVPVPLTGDPVTYQMTEDIDSWDSVTYELTIPAGSEQVDLVSPIVERAGPIDPADEAYREQLFGQVGRITVAGGHVEAALKRVLVVLSPGREAFEDADLDWSQLEDNLRKLAKHSNVLDAATAAQAVALLDIAEKQSLRDYRNHAVHGAWWPFEGVNGRMSRWPRRGHGYMTSFPHSELTKLAVRLELLAEKLNELVRERWPLVTLQPIKPGGAFHQNDSTPRHQDRGKSTPRKSE